MFVEFFWVFKSLFESDMSIWKWYKHLNTQCHRDKMAKCYNNTLKQAPVRQSWSYRQTSHIRHTLVGNKTKTTRMPAFWEYPGRPMITHIIDLNQIPSQILEFCKKLNTWHTFWSCLIRCVNMKWIQQVLWKLQGRHDSVLRRTERRMDGRCETIIHPFQLR